MLSIWLYWSIHSQNWPKWLRFWTGDIFVPLDTQNLKNSDDFNALEQTTDIVGMLSVLWPLSKSVYLMI